MKAIAARNQLTADFLAPTILRKADPRGFALNVVQVHFVRTVKGGEPQFGALSHQVVGDFGLAVGCHDFSSCELTHRYGIALVFKNQIDFMVNGPTCINTRAHAHVSQQVNGDLLQDASTNSAQDIFRRLALNNDVVDACFVQKGA